VIAVMPTPIDRHEVQRMVADGAQLVDVRLGEDYEAEHVRGAVSLPVKTLDRKSAAQLDRGRPVITYCWDYQ
jgi:rhodanese-related sulfurtransferase